MKLYALIGVYNSADTIFDCLVSLIDIVDDIIILDSRWIGYEKTTNFLGSTDETQQEVFRFMTLYPNIEVKYLIGTKEMHQYEARQFLLDQIPEGDWFLWIDSDEIIKSCPPMLKETLDIFTIIGQKGAKISYAEKPETEPQFMDMPRIFRKTKGLHWTTNHRYLNDNDGPVVYGNMPYIKDLQIVHIGQDKQMRPMADKYRHWLRTWELENADNLPNFE